MINRESAASQKSHFNYPRRYALSVGTLMLFLVASLVSCAGNTQHEQSHRQGQPSLTEPATDTLVFNLKQAKSLQQIMNQEKHARVFMVGETHDRYDHHLVQLEALKLLYRQNPDIALGVEWFQQPFQKHLDDFIAGRIDEKQMLERTGYFSRWRFDYRLYQPILQYALEHRIPVIALNASAELTSAISQLGLDGLPDDLKQQLPDSYDWSDKQYEKRLAEIFKLHPDSRRDFDSFLRTQLTWDESMAGRATQYLQENPAHRMLLLSGTGHIQFGSGIPNRIKRRIDVDVVTIMIAEAGNPITPASADYLVMTGEQKLERVGLLGAFLDNKDHPLVIKDFSSNSALKDAGVNKGAVIVGINDEKVTSNTDFRLAMMNKRAGDIIQLYYLENIDSQTQKPGTVEVRLR